MVTAAAEKDPGGKNRVTETDTLEPFTTSKAPDPLPSTSRAAVRTGEAPTKTVDAIGGLTYRRTALALAIEGADCHLTCTVGTTGTFPSMLCSTRKSTLMVKFSDGTRIAGMTARMPLAGQACVGQSKPARTVSTEQLSRGRLAPSTETDTTLYERGEDPAVQLRRSSSVTTTLNAGDVVKPPRSEMGMETVSRSAALTPYTEAGVMGRISRSGSPTTSPSPVAEARGLT
mmetsp:Transcript_15442/g.58459  ORF Transcript_15442/g.58459 Transcript_15442/m.58459 type:complete len:230 (+) Transcript_15442:10362-11051(+)